MEGQEPRLCKCGCGTPLKSARSEFVRGHNNPGYGAGEIRTCLNPGCRKQVRVPMWRLEKWRYCSAKCRADADRRLRPGNKNPLQLRCLNYINANGLTIVAFMQETGLGLHTFYNWMKSKDTTTSRDNIARLAAVLGITEEQAIEEAGGITAEQRRSIMARRIIYEGRLTGGNTPESRRKAAASQRGQPRSLEAREKARRTMQGSPMAARARGRLVAWLASPQGRLVHRLLPFLARNPSPTEGQVQLWADRVAILSETRREVVLAAWRPYLQKRGLWPKGGRRGLEDRHRLVQELMDTWPKKKNGALADGFWGHATRAVSKAEGRQIDPFALKRWWISHTRTCFAFRSAAA